ncbi:unnamed protein product [Aphanomyces euteiches]|nr:hypothetical protein Ae201684P_021445 [Aphanomyces euteiches]
MWTSICNVLNRKPDDLMTEDTSVAIPKAKRVRVYTNKAEVQQLEAEIRDLQAQLILAKHPFESKTEGSMWRDAAKQQCLEKNRSIQENQQLQDAVRERNEYIDRLQRTILRTPRWTALPDTSPAEESRFIPADPASRIAAIHRLADFEYKRFQHVFIQAGAFGLREDTHKAEPISLANNQLGFRAVNHVTLPAPYKVIAQACWSVVSGTHPRVPNAAENDIWEHVDDSTVYNRYWTRPNNARTCYSNEVRKKYEEVDRILLVTVSALHDETVRYDPRDAVDDVNTWWQFVPHPDNPDECSMTVVGLSNISVIIQHEDIKVDPEQVTAEMMRIITASRKSPNVDPPSFLKPLLDHRRRLKAPLQAAIDDVVRLHKQFSDAR